MCLFVFVCALAPWGGPRFPFSSISEIGFPGPPHWAIFTLRGPSINIVNIGLSKGAFGGCGVCDLATRLELGLTLTLTLPAPPTSPFFFFSGA